MGSFAERGSYSAATRRRRPSGQGSAAPRSNRAHQGSPVPQFAAQLRSPGVPRRRWLEARHLEKGQLGGSRRRRDARWS